MTGAVAEATPVVTGRPQYTNVVVYLRILNTGTLPWFLRISYFNFLRINFSPVPP